MKKSKQRGIKVNNFLRITNYSKGVEFKIAGAFVSVSDAQLRKLYVWLDRYFKDK